jgi:CRISPR-associated protein Cas1
MKRLQNVLYITIADAFLALEGETVLVRRENADTGKMITALQLPLHNLEAIVCFSYLGASPALMGACADRGIDLSFLTPNGRFLARVVGRVKGNVLLRKKQVLVSEDAVESGRLASWFLIGKVANCRKVIERGLRDHALLVDAAALAHASNGLREALQRLPGGANADLLGMEGSAAKTYFGVFDQLILQQKEAFFFKERSRRPPMDNMNALLSFLYTLLASEAGSALEAVGLDPYVGFLHQDRPGRPSLALDLMEELRPVFADRLALSLVNRKQIQTKGFTAQENGGVLMDDETRKKVLSAWQERKRETIIHPYLQEKIEFGLIPYVQALLLARYLRGDLDAYPPFFWN